MPSKQQHRGRHPEDAALFSDRWLPRLRAGVADLSYLYSRGYAERAALKLVGDHYQFDLRQRSALQRAGCADEARDRRNARRVEISALSGATLAIDGYNLLITIESALSGGVLIRGRDGCIRDLASLHGSYRKVEETVPALRRIGAALEALSPARVRWYFDAPVSNSGRLRSLLCEEAARNAWAWEVELLPNPDHLLKACGDIVVTSDSGILDYAQRWTNLAAHLVAAIEPPPFVLDFEDPATRA